MREAAGRLGLILWGIFPLVSPLPAAEQAWRGNGQRVGGALTLNDGRLHFHANDGEEVPLADVTRIRFAETTESPFRAGGVRRSKFFTPPPPLLCRTPASGSARRLTTALSLTPPRVISPCFLSY